LRGRCGRVCPPRGFVGRFVEHLACFKRALGAAFLITG